MSPGAACGLRSMAIVIWRAAMGDTHGPCSNVLDSGLALASPLLASASACRSRPQRGVNAFTLTGLLLAQFYSSESSC